MKGILSKFITRLLYSGSMGVSHLGPVSGPVAISDLVPLWLSLITVIFSYSHEPPAVALFAII